MNKTTGVLIGLTAIALIVSGLFYLFQTPEALDNNDLRQSSTELTKNTTATEKKKSIQTLINKFPSEKTPTERHEVIINFNTAPAAGSAIDVINQAFKNGHKGLARQLEAILNARCASVSPTNPTLEDSPQWAVQKMQEYCSSYTEVMLENDFNEQARSVWVHADDQEKKERSLENLPIDQVENEIADSVISAKLPVDLLSAYMLIHDLISSGAEISLGNINKNTLVNNGSDFSDTYYAAFDLYGCYKFGGCAANQAKILEMCMISGQCKMDQSWSVYDYYDNTLSPNNMENVQAILQYLFDKQIHG